MDIQAGQDTAHFHGELKLMLKTKTATKKTIIIFKFDTKNIGFKICIYFCCCCVEWIMAF